MKVWYLVDNDEKRLLYKRGGDAPKVFDQVGILTNHSPYGAAHGITYLNTDFRPATVADFKRLRTHVPPDFEPEIGHRIGLLAERTPGNPAHGFHTFHREFFNNLPEGIGPGDHYDIVMVLGRLAPMFLGAPGKEIDESDAISAATLSVIRDIPSDVKLFYRVESFPKEELDAS